MSLPIDFRDLIPYLPEGFHSEKVAEILTLRGFETELSAKITNSEHLQEYLVIGEIEQVEKHPQADRLNVCQVRVAADQRLQIICGCPSVAQGLKVAVALPGCQLPKITIKSAKIRSVDSCGMLCSMEEIGLPQTADHIIHLPTDAPIGQSLVTYWHLQHPYLEVDITPNRGDCLSFHGIYRELAAALDLPPLPQITPLQTQNPSAKPLIGTEDRALCPHLSYMVIRGLDHQVALPESVSAILASHQMRSISPIVDVLNAVMLELGQPMHAFDLDKIATPLQIQALSSSQTFTALDGQDLMLPAGAIVVQDQQVQALAGVIGGEHSAVSEQTQSVLIECATFDPVAIATTLRALSMTTDAASRFERGVDPQLHATALARLWQLVQQCMPQAQCTEVYIDAHPLAEHPCTLTPQDLEYIGVEFSDDFIQTSLTKLGISVEKQGQDWLLLPPSHRYDLRRPCDYAEELTRLYGYENIVPTLAMPPVNVDIEDAFDHHADIAEHLVTLGFNEVIGYSFVSEEEAGLSGHDRFIRVKNAINQKFEVLRTSLLPGMLKFAQHQVRRQAPVFKLFEMGRIYPSDQSEQSQQCLSLVISGGDNPHWQHQTQVNDFYTLKGLLLSLMKMTGMDTTALDFQALQHPLFHPGKSAAMSYQGKILACLGVIHPRTAEQYQLSQDTLMLQLDLVCLPQQHQVNYQFMPQYPHVERDLSFTLDQAVDYAQIVSVIEESKPEILVKLTLFDVYYSESLGDGKKNVAIRFIFQSNCRTLSNEEVDQGMQDIQGQLEAKLKVRVRNND